MSKDHRPFRVGSLFLPILTSLVLIHAASAAVNVDSSQAITHRVTVQPICVKKTNGTTAEFMGSSSSEEYIKQQINLIWAQVGVEINWLPIVEYTDDFAYDGSPGNYNTTARPTSHLDTIVSSSGTPPRSPSEIELNLFFVGVSAGFKKLSANSVAGLAKVDRNGSTIYVGGNLLTWSAGRDVVASVIAHEIGHNLGLNHYQSSISNLMYSGSDGNGEELIGSQQSTIFTDGSRIDGYDFLQTLPAGSNYLVWEALHELEQGPAGDDDGDHLSNAFEFLYGSSPKIFTPHPSASITSEGLTWTLNKESGAVADGFAYQAESSLDLDDWTPADSPSASSHVLEDSSDTFRVLLSSGSRSAFVRFGVSIPAAARLASLIPPATLQLAPEAEPAAHSGCGIGSCGHATLYRK